MILYIDTSGLVKLYVEEAHSAQVRAWVTKADLVATGRIAYPEALSAVARRFRSGDLAREAYERVVAGLEEDWSSYTAPMRFTWPRSSACKRPAPASRWRFARSTPT